MELNNLPLKIKNVLSIITMALMFSAIFLIRCDPIENSVSVTLAVYISTFTFILVPSVLSYKYGISLRKLYAGLLVLVVVWLLSLPFLTGPMSLFSAVVVGGISGLTILLTVGILFYASFEKARRLILLGVAGATLVLPLFHFFSNFNDAQIRQILFLLSLFSIAGFLYIEKKTATNFKLAKDSDYKAGETKRDWIGLLSSQRRSNLVTLVITIPFFFCQGIFGNISFEKGFSFASSDSIMVATCFVILILYFADRIKRTNTWFNMICFIVGAGYVTIIFSTLIINDHPSYVYGIMRAGLILMQIRVFVLLTEVSIKESLSPLYLYRVLAFIYFIPNIAGYFVAHLLNGFEDYASLLVSGALMVIAIVAGALIVFLMKKMNFDLEEKLLNSESTDFGDEKNFERFCADYGLSQKESEVIRLYSQGRNVRNISAKLYLSQSTIKTYIQRVYTKLDIHSKQELLDAIDESSRNQGDQGNP